jgi:hypothetical protein
MYIRQTTPEADLLRLTRQREVEGVVELFGYHQIASVDEMREGLTFTKPYVFRNAAPSSSFSQSQAKNLLTQSFTHFHGLSIAEGSSRKRKSVDVGVRPSKVSSNE